MEGALGAIKELWDVPHPGNQGLMRREHMEELCVALDWKVEAILKGCRANAYGVVEYDQWERVMLNRLDKNFRGNAEPFAKKISNQAAMAREKIHEMRNTPPQEEEEEEEDESAGEPEAEGSVAEGMAEEQDAPGEIGDLSLIHI
eukprot:TRINITY_DN14777_c0_g1_i3.p2 TRINITY_DN14777_c0_g1~~TRINITY_DN14777_c0_g1_i3.p2  ORF type:complete len:145 (-),score=53.94 TRINITY_DN14777_c0_g1_i3:167-601(-)